MQDQAASEDSLMELTILMPCLNESETLATCIQKARAFLDRARIDGEVVIADNGSTDGSQDIAVANGARVVPIPVRGYGSALIGGIRAARGRYVIMADSDDSYDFSALDPFVEKLRQGWQLVMGNRFQGGIAPGAMPKLHRYLGNPVLTAVGRVFFGSPCGDFHCGLRGFERDAILSLDLQATGMEFASEMVVKATIHKLKVTEVPTTLSPDGRSRPPHLRSWRDGWRHLRFLLLFSPRSLFLYPGMALLLPGSLLSVWLLPASRHIGGLQLDIHTLLYTSVAMVIGVQAILFWVFAKIYGQRERIVPLDPAFDAALQAATLERVLIAGGVLVLSGLGLGVYALSAWNAHGFGQLSPDMTMRIVIPSATAILIGMQLAYSAFFLTLLGISASAQDYQPMPGEKLAKGDSSGRLATMTS